MFYAKSTGGFYKYEIHGDSIPSDAIEITDDDHNALLAAQSAGLHISADDTGLPVAIAPPSLSPEKRAKLDLLGLESSITPRRLRESVLGIDGGWLSDVNAQIERLRKKL